MEFEISGQTTEIGMCHCSTCRKVSGVASNATLMVSRENLEWISREHDLLKLAFPDGWGRGAAPHADRRHPSSATASEAQS
ncbi:MAG: GFA family protein [Deltaproteobacteria bacterium]|nr:GFA family protein [Deltaproteobacteria bacterium]MBW2373964.1 GFA family protein [Deltaproteobacteria bacterium]